LGVLARVLTFPSVEKKLKAFEIIEGLVKQGHPQDYANVNLYNEDYNLNVRIRLLFRIFLQSRLQSNDISDIYKIEIDVPVEHVSLEGMFRVKEGREAQLVHLKTPPVENIAIMSTEHGSKTITHALKALHKYGFMADESFIEIPRGTKAIEILKELGNIGWVFVSDVPDIHLRGAGLYGTKLQNSEVLEDLTSRGGRVKAAIIEHQQRGIGIVISERGSIYSQRRIDIVTLARLIREVITIMIKHNLVKTSRF
jgi:hypothetical protein